MRCSRQMARKESEVQGIGCETQEGTSMIYVALTSSIAFIVIAIAGALPS